jgi:hypothetical protein
LSLRGDGNFSRAPHHVPFPDTGSFSRGLRFAGLVQRTAMLDATVFAMQCASAAFLTAGGLLSFYCLIAECDLAAVIQPRFALRS